MVQPSRLALIAIFFTASVPSVLVVCPVQSSAASIISDDFESFAPGSFPSPPWLDAGTVAPTQPLPPDPSVTVVSTTDAFGAPTRAVSLEAAVSGTPQGIFQAIPTSPTYSLGVDLRIDAFSDGGSEEFQQWAFEAAFLVNDGTSFNSADQIGIFASSVTNDFRLFAINNGQTTDLPLGMG